MIFEKLGIALTDRCTASCAMCCFRCKPENKQVLSKETVFSLIHQATEIPEITSVGLTGGEAMLYPELVLDSIAEIKRCGMKATLTSNGFWASDEKSARETLLALKSAGLDNLAVSVDAFHMQYVPLESIRNILRLFPKANLPLSIAIGDAPQGPRAYEIVKALGQDLYNLHATIYSFMPIGAGEDLPADRFITKAYSKDWKCIFQGDFLVFADGMTYPCCSQAVYNSHLSNGSIYRNSLRELMDSYEQLCLFAGLRRLGFAKLLEIARQAEISLPSAFVSPCHLCNLLFRSEAFCEIVRPHIEQEYIAVVKAALGISAKSSV